MLLVNHSGSPKRPSSQPDQYASVWSGDFQDTGAEMGVTSDPQAGHRYTSSGRRLISGWPHSQAWPPAASGREIIQLSVSRSAPPRTPPHSSQRRELRPKERSSASEQKGQVRVLYPPLESSMLPPFSSALLTPLIMEQWIQSGIA